MAPPRGRGGWLLAAAGTLLARKGADALLALKGTDAVHADVELAVGPPLNFTALLNGDAIKRKKAEIEAKFAETTEKTLQGHVSIPMGLPNFTELLANFEKKFHREKKASAPAPCIFPIVGDKVVYMVQGAMTTDLPDSELTAEGIRQATALPNDVRLSRALGLGPGRAEVVIMGPMRKTMQTALLAFGDKLPDVKWEIDMDARGIKHESEPVHEDGVTLLERIGAPQSLVENYDRVVRAGDHGTHEERWHRFIDKLRRRSEKTIIVVTHNYGCELTHIDIPIGEVRIAGLLADPPQEFDDIAYGGNAWHQLSKPACWPANVTM